MKKKGVENDVLGIILSKLESIENKLEEMDTQIDEMKSSVGMIEYNMDDKFDNVTKQFEELAEGVCMSLQSFDKTKVNPFG